MSSQSFSQLITVNLHYNGIKITMQCSDVNCVKSIRIRGWSGPHFATFWVKTGNCSVNLYTQSKCRKKGRTRKKIINICSSIIFLFQLKVVSFNHTIEFCSQALPKKRPSQIRPTSEITLEMISSQVLPSNKPII